MASFLYIEYDRTPPVIEIYAPSYTTSDLVNIIVIESNENLSDFQDIYIMDGYGARYDFTFKRETNNKFVGLVKFSDIPFGISTIYARMKDDVDNYSNLVSKTITVIEYYILLNLDESHSDRGVQIKDKDMNINISNKVNSINDNIKERKVDVNSVFK